MLTALPPLEAFRQDTARQRGDGGPDEATLARWLEVAVRLARATEVEAEERERLLAALLASEKVMALPRRQVSREAVVAFVMPMVNAMSDVAWFRLAQSLVSSLLVLVPEEMAAARGRLLAHAARLTRHTGDEESARELYASAEVVGREHGLPEVVGRAWLGFGILAYERGDFPTARHHFESVIELPGALRETVTFAHHHLMITAARAKDYDTAATHAWSVFEDASTHEQQTEALINLSQLFLDAGHARTALRGFAASLVRSPMPRQALPALGGAACAAACAVDVPANKVLVRNFAARIEAMVANLGGGETLPHACASALIEVSEALAAVGDTRESYRVAGRGELLARRHDFHELVYRLDHPHVQPAPVQLTRTASAIREAVEALDGAEMVGAPS